MKSEGDLAQLGETFNKMTQELRSQRDELVNASELIDSRRRFIEAVLSSASAGIIGVDASGSVGILNRSAEKLIGHAEAETLGHPLSDVLPELDEMMKTAREGHAAAGAGPDHDHARRPRAQSVGPRQRREDQPVARQLHHHARRHHRARLGAAHLGLGRRRPPHRPRDQEPADADPALRRAHPPQIRQGPSPRPRTSRSSSSAPTPSCARSTTSGAWSTSSRALRGCRSP